LQTDSKKWETVRFSQAVAESAILLYYDFSAVGVTAAIAKKSDTSRTM